VKNRNAESRSPYRAKKELNGRVFGTGARRIHLDKKKRASFLGESYLNQHQADRIWPYVKVALKGHDLGKDESERRQEILRLSNLSAIGTRIEKVWGLIRNLILEMKRPPRISVYGELFQLESGINWLEQTLNTLEPVISYIIEENEEATAERLFTDFCNKARTARKLRRQNRSSAAATVNRHHRFLLTTLQLTERLQRPPLLKEIREQLLAEGLTIGSDEVGRVARANGLGWLKPGSRGKAAIDT
jgi:hypothetical protein